MRRARASPDSGPPIERVCSGDRAHVMRLGLESAVVEDPYARERDLRAGVR
jgi:hypothetical protein